MAIDFVLKTNTAIIYFMYIKPYSASFISLQATNDISEGKQNIKGMMIAEKLDDMAGRNQYKAWNDTPNTNTVADNTQSWTEVSKKLNIF